MREIKMPSVIPVYSIGAFWAVCAMLFPLYEWLHFVVAAAGSAVVYLIVSRFVPPTVRRVEHPLTEDPALDRALEQWSAFLQELRVLAADRPAGDETAYRGVDRCRCPDVQGSREQPATTRANPVVLHPLLSCCA